MYTEIVISLLAALIPVVWFYLNKRLMELAKDSDYLKDVIIGSSKELTELYSLVLAKVKEKAKDGVISEDEKKEIIDYALAEAKKRSIDIAKYLAPRTYQFLLEKMLKS